MANKRRLVILGTGFAGFSLLRNIDTRLFDMTVVSPRNHFLFTPLLPGTTVGTIEFRSIIEPVRSARPEAQYVQAWCEGIDTRRKRIQCRGAIDRKLFTLPYDHLVIAVGSVSNTYGIPGVEQFALFLKDLADARKIRQKLIECLEQASQPHVSAAERKRLLRFVVVGGGPTGVEFAAEMHDFVADDLRKYYPTLMREVRITLLEAGDHILNTFDEALSQYTMRIFARQKIEIRTRSLVTRIDKNNIVLSDRTKTPYGLVVWSTGIGPTTLARKTKLPKDKAGRLVTDEFFQVKGTSQLYALGDCMSVEGKNYPATAQVAQQEGRYLAQALGERARGRQPGPFRYRPYGMLAYIGGARALADLAAFKGKGFSAWLFWRSVYLTKLVSLKNKILVVFDWMKTLFFGRDISRF